MSRDPCGEMHLLIQADLDGELDPASAARVQDHLEGCPDCAELQRRFLALSAELKRDVPRFAAPPALRAAVRASVSGSRSRRGWGARPWAIGAMSAAAALAASLALFTVLPHPDRAAEWIVAAHIRALQPEHLTDVVSTEQHTVKPWFNGRLPFSPPVIDLASAGFPLVGGRVDYLPGHPAAVLIYKRRQHIIDLFVWPTSVDGDRTDTSGVQDGYNFIRWHKGDMTFWAVSDLNAAELASFCAHWQ